MPRMFDALAGDLRFAFRYFARHKSTTAIIIVVIALATGGNTLIFSTFQSQFLRSAPAVPADDALARIWAQERPSRSAAWEPRDFTQPELTALAERRELFASVAAWTEDEVVIGGDSTPARTVNAQFVTANYFGTLGVPLVSGQGLRQDGGDAADLSAVISYLLAEQLYGGAAAAVGRQVLVNAVPIPIVGVAPPRFQGALRNMDEPAVFMPVSARALIAHVSPRWLADDASLALFARLAPGASHQRATAFARLVVAGALPDSAARVGMTRTADVLGLQSLPPGSESSEIILAFTLMIVIGVLILLVGWMNVSSLMVAAAVGRRHEIAVRLSLGASRPRVLRQLVTESTLLALVGSALGLTLAFWELTWMAKSEIDGVDIAPDAGTFIFVMAMAVVTGILFGLSPALHATRGGVANALRDSGGGVGKKSRLQRGFVVAQIALSQPLLVLLGTMVTMVIADYQPRSPEMSLHVISASFRPLERGAPGQRPADVDSLVPRIAAQPGVLNAVPEATGFAIRGIVAEGRAARAQGDSAATIITVEGAAPGWFAVVDIPIILGRDVSLADTAAAERPIVIGSALARALWGDANPLGRRLASPSLPNFSQDSIGMTVVGVYDEARRSTRMTWDGGTARGSVMPRVYTAHGRQWRHDEILVRTQGPAAPYVPELQRFVRAQAPSLPVTTMLTLAQVDAAEYQETLQVSAGAGAGGLLALLLASLGLYGVVSLAVRQRTREIGIRIALGAEPMRVARMFLASGLRTSLVALALGLPLSVIALKIGISQGAILGPEVNPFLIGGAIALILVAVAAAATWVPARRAALVNPARTLSAE